MPSCWPPVAWPSLPCSTSCSDPACRIRKTGRPPVSVPVDVFFCARRPARSMRPARPASRIKEGGGERLLPESPLCRACGNSPHHAITAGRCRNIRDSEETRTGTDGHCDPGPCRPGCPMTGAGVNPPPFCRACWRHRPHRETRPTGRRRSLLPAGQDRHDAWSHRASGPSGTAPYRRIGASRSHRAGGQRIKKTTGCPGGGAAGQRGRMF